MIGHHAIYTNMRKGLDFLSSMYAHDHVYWKDEIKEWNPAIGERQYWTYNCKDACITWEITPEIQAAQAENADPEHCEFQQNQFFPVLRMMLRGIRINQGLKAELGKGLLELSFDRQQQLEYLVGHYLNVDSPKQLQDFLYKDLGLKGIRNFKTGTLTANAQAMNEIALREPCLKPLCQLIVELKSLRVFKSTFVDAELDVDERMRCAFGIAATETNRYNSRENAFGTGMNLMNIPVAAKEKIKSETYVKLPNIRKLFIPDPGFTFFDMDLDRADLQVVVWEADDKNLKLALRQGIDIHCLNACDIFNITGIPPDELTETHPNYKDRRAQIGESYRAKAKAGVHATNYGVGDRTLAMALGITVHEASLFRKNWFSAKPGIKKWHDRTTEQVTKRGFIENKFGARFYKLGRFDLPEFLGWLPQSTVAGVINRALLNIDAQEQAGKTSIQLLIQVHDSLAGQFLSSKRDAEIANLKEWSQIIVPYDDPLVIPTSVNCSIISWGDCK
jgi:DNA polymerase-1